MSPRSIRKPALVQQLTSEKHVTSMSSELEPTILSRDTGQQTPYFDSRLKDAVNQGSMSQPVSWSVAAILGNSAVVERTRSRTILLAITTMGKSIHGFPFLSSEYGAPLIYRFSQA